MDAVLDQPPSPPVVADRDRLTDRDLVLKFESVGDNCELGLVQRLVGAEPLGMFRFAGAPLSHLLRALNARFEGMADPAHIRVQAENGEYMVRLTKYDFIYHAHVKVGAADPVALHAQQSRTVRFLIDKLINDLTNPEKILVFRQNEPLLASDLIDLRTALARFGRSTLLWVQEARPGHPPGTVDIVDETLMAGYVQRLALRQSVPDLDLESWLAVLRRAWFMWPARLGPIAAASPAPAQPSLPRVEIAFGAEGNATDSTGYGWSAPENGFTWAIDDRSLLSLNPPPDADGYWLEMDVVPYVSPPLVPKQCLTVSVNGTPVHVFDPLVRGRAACSVPGHLVKGTDKVEILLDHPQAARPSDVAGENDDRRLAISFRGLSLACAPGA